MYNEYELEAIYDGRKSFYKKAHVREYRHNDKKVLRSYTTDVAEISNGKASVYGTYSMTTMRHINEFLLQSGFEPAGKNEILKKYPA